MYKSCKIKKHDINNKSFNEIVLCLFYSLNVRIRHEGKQPMALVGANFPEIKTPAETGEIINTPVKDLLEQFKADRESSQRELEMDTGNTKSKHPTSLLKEVRFSRIVFV